MTTAMVGILLLALLVLSLHLACQLRDARRRAAWLARALRETPRRLDGPPPSRGLIVLRGGGSGTVSACRPRPPGRSTRR